MSIRVGAQEFPITSAELTYTRLPNGTIGVFVEIASKAEQWVTLSLNPPPLPGRTLADLTGQAQVLTSPTKPDRYDPRAVNGVASIYAGTHEDVFESRLEWGRVDERGIALHWTGVVNDLDIYRNPPKHTLVVDTTLLAIERPHRCVFSNYGEGDEVSRIDAVKDSVVKSFDERLTASKWFEGMPFVAVEVVVRVEAKGRSWPALPTLPANEPPFIVAKLPRALVMSGDSESIRRALEAEINDGLGLLEKRYRQAQPSFL